VAFAELLRLEVIVGFAIFWIGAVYILFGDYLVRLVKWLMKRYKERRR